MSQIFTRRRFFYGALLAVTLYRSDSIPGDARLPPGLTAEQARKVPGQGPQVGPAGSGYNCLFVGSKGFMGTSGRGEGVGLLPGSRWAEYKLPGANHSGVRACKGGAPACSNFSVAEPYAESLALGAGPTHYEGKLPWDAAKMEITKSREGNKWVRPVFRRGWVKL